MKRESPFLTIWEEAASGLFDSIKNNKELNEYELAGLVEGEKRGKKPNVPLKVLTDALHKQYLDFLKAYGDDDKEAMKKTLADLRSVAGILFLKFIHVRKKGVKA